LPDTVLEGFRLLKIGFCELKDYRFMFRGSIGLKVEEKLGLVKKATLMGGK
jgi:hypothetical protein